MIAEAALCVAFLCSPENAQPHLHALKIDMILHQRAVNIMRDRWLGSMGIESLRAHAAYRGELANCRMFRDLVGFPSGRYCQGE